MQKRILLSLLWGVIFSLSLFSQNLKAEKITPVSYTHLRAHET